MIHVDFKDEGALKDYLEDIDELSPNEFNADHVSQMAVHLKGGDPSVLLDRARPNEPPEVQAYRLEVYEPTTFSDGKRILSTLSKIQKSSSYSIEYGKQDGIPEGETLEAYVNDYPLFGNLELLSC